MQQIATLPISEIETQPVDEVVPSGVSEELGHIEKLNFDAESRWANKLFVDNSLTRALVSFQANKGRAVYRWFKYKEAFSAGLIEHLLSKYRIINGILLDPFAGSGTALFAAGGLGMKAEGIELLPIGRTIITTKQVIDWDLTKVDVKRLAFWRDEHPWRKSKTAKAINELRITRGAYPPETLDAMGHFLAASEQEGDRVKAVLFFALNRIHVAFTKEKLSPHTFFVGAAIESEMAKEIWEMLKRGDLENAANLTEDDQIASITSWLCKL